MISAQQDSRPPALFLCTRCLHLCTRCIHLQCCRTARVQAWQEAVYGMDTAVCRIDTAVRCIDTGTHTVCDTGGCRRHGNLRTHAYMQARAQNGLFAGRMFQRYLRSDPYLLGGLSLSSPFSCACAPPVSSSCLVHHVWSRSLGTSYPSSASHYLALPSREPDWRRGCQQRIGRDRFCASGHKPQPSHTMQARRTRNRCQPSSRLPHLLHLRHASFLPSQHSLRVLRGAFHNALHNTQCLPQCLYAVVASRSPRRQEPALAFLCHLRPRLPLPRKSCVQGVVSEHSCGNTDVASEHSCVVASENSKGVLHCA